MSFIWSQCDCWIRDDKCTSKIKGTSHRGHEVRDYGKGCGFSTRLKPKCSEYLSMNVIIEEGNFEVGSSVQLVLCWVALGAKCSGVDMRS